MERLTDERLAIPPGQWQEVTPEDARELKDIPVPPMRELYYRLSQIEDILGDDYDLDRLSVMCNQRMTMREEVSQRFSLTAKIPLDRLREIAEAERDGRCVVLPCKPGDTVWRIVNDVTPHITKDQCLAIMLDNGSMWVDLIENGMNGLYFGQRLFRARAEAEAALRREQDE